MGFSFAIQIDRIYVFLTQTSALLEFDDVEEEDVIRLECMLFIN
jgi:hypothetical protein